VKLPAHRSGLPGKEMSFLIVPLGPAYKAGLAGHLPVKVQMPNAKSKEFQMSKRTEIRLRPRPEVKG